MWSRKTVKRRGKRAMRRNYWKTLLVSLILATILGGASGSSAVSSGMSSGAAAAAGGNTYRQVQSGDVYDGPLTEEMLQNAGLNVTVNPESDPEVGIEIPGMPDELIQGLTVDPATGQASNERILMLMVFIGIVVLIILVIAILVSVFVLNPLEVGIRRFFTINMRTKAELKEVAFGYDTNYGKNVKTLFLRDLFLILWTLLFIIPGIIKAYQYRMIPYLLADHPEMTRKEVFTASKELMRGNKWKTFVLDLSFIGWYLLSVLTLGILHVFYVAPYKNMTDAALYERLMYGKKEESSAIPQLEEL